ncbi:carboxypeptidase-like regulatory domain-containing protein [Maribellus sp. YY47]|uniref:carboxypeptidase-like regulatory domain-containing protein n=1 Tax=Maribellus sp. YY47 TaxID=2929486 RepID=UPI00200082B5|nr:carboxypeptidase-like regulatory domain-containing protein [Maribellus sp. YY47]MCK3683011.1 carboxypeptidase-like regulatory domain-containing protein [Maribellus sp. YY47]
MKTVILTHVIFILWMLPGPGWAQVITISGYINNSISGKAIENVSILEANSGVGTISNQNGFYRLVLKGKDIDLKISNDGFKDFSKQLSLSADTTLVVKLVPKADDKRRQKKAGEIHAEAKPEKKSTDQQNWSPF